jgi:hypothetical protein
MAIQQLDYFYSRQIPRFLEQIVKAFSGFQYMTGWRNGQPPAPRQVPCRLATKDRMIANIMRNNSENVMLSVPMITVTHTGISGRRNDVQFLSHVDTQQVHERAFDGVTGDYTGASGNRYTVQRMMPRPFELTIQVDVWTSNDDQKYQLMEQILTIFYPDIEIQNSENPLDWTAKTRIEMDEITWTSRTMPIGTENEIEISTMQLKLPFWLTPPAKVQQQRIIQQVVSNIYDADQIHDGTGGEITDTAFSGGLLTQDIITPGDFRIRVQSGSITLLGPKGSLHDSNGALYRWDTLLAEYGNIRPTISTLRLKRGADIETTSEIIGTIQFDSQNVNKLVWQIDPDTLPANTLSPLNAIIDPLKVAPGDGLAAAAVGQRYLLLEPLGNSTTYWGNIVAGENDIIQYISGQWQVVFDASTMPNPDQYVLNTYSGSQLRWTGEDWVLAIEGEYSGGYWRLTI